MSQSSIRKTYVLDTNIFIHNPNCMNKFEDNEIVIPYVVLEELDGLKTSRDGEVAYNARETLRKLKSLREKGNLLKGVQMDNGGLISVYAPMEKEVMEEKFGYNISLPEGWNNEKADNRILLSIMNLMEEESMGDDDENQIILVSNDSNMLIKADCLGIRAQEYKNDRVANISDIYKGKSIRYISDKDFEKLIENKRLDVTMESFICEQIPYPYDGEFINVLNSSGGSLLTKYRNNQLELLSFDKSHPCGLAPRNSGQTFLEESLMEDYNICPLTICNGPAGTGKTLFAVGCGLEQVMESKKYKQVLVCRPNVMMDEEIGFLPGTEKEKISPLLRGVYDNLEVLLGNKDDSLDQIQDKINELFQRGYITAQSIAYLRGRSISNTYIIIDECQNASPNQIFSIITRAGEGTKIVLLGDVNQIDNPRLDSKNNGLVYAIERMKDSSLSQVVTFEEKECIRSRLAREASDKLKK